MSWGGAGVVVGAMGVSRGFLCGGYDDTPPSSLSDEEARLAESLLPSVGGPDFAVTGQRLTTISQMSRIKKENATLEKNCPKF